MEEYDVTMAVPRAKSNNNGEMSDRCLSLVDLCVQDIKMRVRNKIIYELARKAIFVFREAIRQWFSLATSSLVKSVTESPHAWQKRHPR